MKKILPALIVLCFSCTPNHFHDGVYESPVVNERLTIMGNNMKAETIDYRGIAFQTVNFDITQYPDKVTYTSGDTIMTLHFNPDSSLQSATAYYKKIF